MTKNSFVLRNENLDIIMDLSDKQAGILFKAVYLYATNGEIFDGLTDESVKMAFRFIKKDIDYDAKKYAETCARRAEAGRIGGIANQANASKSKQIKQMLANASKSKHIDSDSDVVSDSDNNKLLTAPKSAGCVQPKPRQLTDLQKFAKAVADRFEDPMDRTQLGIWYRRNCRCLTDILNFCGKNIPLGLETISVCVKRLEKAGLSGGYEAVARNLPEYLAQAKKQMEVINAGN